MFALDGSRDLRPEGFVLVKNSINTILDSLTISPRDSQVGVLEYSDKANIAFHLNQNRNVKDVKEAIQNIQPSLGAARVTDEALKSVAMEMFAARNGALPGVPKVFVLFTSGKSTGSQPLREAATALREHGVMTYVVGIGKRVDRDELVGLVPGGEDVLLLIDQPDHLPGVVPDIIRSILNHTPKSKFKRSPRVVN